MLPTKIPDAIPTNATELEELLGNPAVVTELMNQGKFAEVIKNYADATRKADPALLEQIKNESQRVMVDWLKENQGANISRVNMDPTSNLNVGGNKLYNKRAPGAGLDKEFLGATEGDLYSATGEFFKNIWFRNHSASADAFRSKMDSFRNALGSQVPADGGFLIPEVLRSELLRVALESAIVRPRARVIPMESLRVPFPMIDSTSDVSSVYGGVIAYWTEEAGALTASSPKFGRVVLEAKKLTAYSEVPNELFQDAIGSLEVLLNQLFPEAIAFEEDYRFMLGGGAGEPLGFINSAASVAVAAESGQVSGTIVWENVVKMYSRMLPASLSRAVWIASIDTFPELATMALSVGTGGAPVWLSSGAQGPPMTILGRPVFFTEKTPTKGTTGDINFVDLGYYLIGDRMAMQAATSADYKFANDQTAIRFIERVDGRPWLNSAITPKNNSSNTLSPFVQIATR